MFKDRNLDFHQWTADLDPAFHQQMDCLDAITNSSPPWRHRLTPLEIRKYAKRFNFFRLYGWKAEDSQRGQRQRDAFKKIIGVGLTASKSPDEIAAELTDLLSDAQEDQ
jgi:hypothetical protein